MRILFLLAAILLASPSYAAGARDAFELINNCAKNKYATPCRVILTPESLTLFDHFNSYGLAKCLPGDVKFVSATPAPPYSIIRASTSITGQPRTMRLAFIQNNGGEWKLDVPESLRIGMGQNWKQQVDAMDQLYSYLHKQLKGGLGCPDLKNTKQ